MTDFGIGAIIAAQAAASASYAQEQAAAQMAQHYNLGMAGMAGFAAASPWASVGQQAYDRLVVKPCPYCHRTDQKPEHKSCDGCGAPR